MSFKERNFWLTTVEMPKADATQPLPESVDVAVIGAGYTGLSATRTLAKHGAKVAVLEAETVGWGARSRNGGIGPSRPKPGGKKLVFLDGPRTRRPLEPAFFGPFR